MERRIEKLGIEEGKKVYYERLVEDFPACEVKPWEKIEQFTEAGLYDMFGMWEEGVLLAYAFVAMDVSKKHLLMDYFAVSNDWRGKGYGQYFLAHLWELYPDTTGVIFEVEDVEEAVNEQERVLRKRRIHFYEKVGLQMYPVCARVYDACYQLMFFSNTENMPDTEQIIEGYKALYRVILGVEKMEKHMEIIEKKVICAK